MRVNMALKSDGTVQSVKLFAGKLIFDVYN